MPGQPPVTGYKELAALIRRQIRDGDLRPGQRLPSEVALRQTYDLSRWTVRQAMASLRADGLVDYVRGWGMVVREPVPMDDLHVEPGWTVTTRMPTVEERQEHDIPDGVPVFVVLYPSGAGDIYPGDRYRLSVN
mgnify:FL=1